MCCNAIKTHGYRPKRDVGTVYAVRLSEGGGVKKKFKKKHTHLGRKNNFCRGTARRVLPTKRGEGMAKEFFDK